MVAQLGIVLYMFLIGLHMNSSILRSRAQATVLISHVSIVFPFLLGAILWLLLYRDFCEWKLVHELFAVFGFVAGGYRVSGVSRILTDRGIAETELGVIAMSCAAADDVTAWCLLAIVVGVTQGTVANAVATVVVSLVFIALMLGVAGPGDEKVVSERQMDAEQSARDDVDCGGVFGVGIDYGRDRHSRDFGAFILAPSFRTIARLQMNSATSWKIWSRYC